MLINCCKKIDKFSLSKWATISSKRIIGGFPNFFEIAKELKMKKESKSLKDVGGVVGIPSLGDMIRGK